MKKYRNKIIIICIIVILFFITKYSGLENYFSFNNIKKNINFFQQMVEKNYLFSVISYIIIYTVITGFSIPVATYLTLGGGFLFGTILAAIYVNIGATTGAIIVFLLDRYLFGDILQKKYQDKLNKFNKELEINGSNYLLTLRFIPVFPFFLINILAGLTKIPLKIFIWTTSVGIFPGSLVYSFAGNQLNYISSVRDIFTLKVLVAFLLLALFAILPVIIKHIKNNRREKINV